MSWFDTKQLSTFAKSALNEAQKTLDKALDIREEEEKENRRNSAAAVSEAKDFAESGGEENATESATVPQGAPSGSALAASVMGSSKIWGSFTGSFFDPNQKKAGSDHEDEDGESVEDDRATPVPKPMPISAPSVVTSAPILSQPSSNSPSKSDVASSSNPMSQSAFLEETSDEELRVMQQLHDPAGETPSEAPDEGNGFSTSQLVIAPDDEELQCESTTDDLGSSMSSSNQTVMHSSREDEAHQPAVLEPTDVALLVTPNTPTEAGTVPTLMEDAMAETFSEKRSETSSSRSFEVVAKFPSSSQPASEVTSGDELETHTTSSDIEVIASPTPSQATTAASSRLSSTSAPSAGAGRDKRTHARTGSEVSQSGSGSSAEDASSCSAEVEKLNRRLTEMSEMLEAREAKVLQLSNANFELVEKNTDLSRYEQYPWYIKECRKCFAPFS